MGFESKKINGKNKYIVVLADPNRQSIERKTYAEEIAKSMVNLGIEQGASTSTDTDHQLPF